MSARHGFGCGELELARGNCRGALAATLEALTLAERIGFTLFDRLSRRLRGEILLMAGRLDEAAAEFAYLRGSQMQEAYQARTQPLNELNALMSGSQATIPQFQAFQGSPVAASNIGQYISDNYKNQSQAAAATNAGIFGLGGGLAKLGVGMM